MLSRMLWTFLALADVIIDQMRKLGPQSGTGQALRVFALVRKLTSGRHLRQQHTTKTSQLASCAAPKLWEVILRRPSLHAYRTLLPSLGHKVYSLPRRISKRSTQLHGALHGLFEDEGISWRKLFGRRQLRQSGEGSEMQGNSMSVWGGCPNSLKGEAISCTIFKMPPVQGSCLSRSRTMRNAW